MSGRTACRSRDRGEHTNARTRVYTRVRAFACSGGEMFVCSEVFACSEGCPYDGRGRPFGDTRAEGTYSPVLRGPCGSIRASAVVRGRRRSLVRRCSPVRRGARTTGGGVRLGAPVRRGRVCLCGSIRPVGPHAGRLFAVRAVCPLCKASVCRAGPSVRCAGSLSLVRAVCRPCGGGIFSIIFRKNAAGS